MATKIVNRLTLNQIGILFGLILPCLSGLGLLYNNYTNTIKELQEAHASLATTGNLNAKYNQLILSSNHTKIMLWDAQKKQGTFNPDDEGKYKTIQSAIKRQELQMACDTGVDLTACSVTPNTYGGEQ